MEPMENQTENQISPEINPPSEPKKKSPLIITLIVVIAILLVAVGALAGYVLVYTMANNNLPVNQNTNTNSNTNGVEPEDQDNKTIKINWHDPVAIPSMKIFTKVGDFDRENGDDFSVGAKYYEVGAVENGQYRGGKVIMTTSLNNDPSGLQFHRFILKNGALTLIAKYSDQIGEAMPTEKFQTDNELVISELDFPETLTNTINKAVLNREKYAQAIFSAKELVKVYTDPKYGDVYTSNSSINTDMAGVAKGGFYLKAADGTVKVYTMKIDFVQDKLVPSVVWNDGTQNKTNYDYRGNIGCGFIYYISVVGDLTKEDLIVAGQTSTGEPVYEIKDKESMVLKNFYSEYQVATGEQKASYEEFVSNHPVFFWYDPFGRLIKFRNATYGPMAECGKPVIYLYPEKTTAVSVKLEPQGGFTYTEPAYNGGWSVVAEPNGNLTEMASGKNYPYLFWEGRGGIYQTPTMGFVVRQGEVHGFLIQKLAELGLNQNESADFIEFWEPRMQGAPYYFVSFFGNRLMDEIAPLTITPKPDTVIRILMDFQPLQKPIKVQGYPIKTPVRQGFTVVEWGGVLR